jgi:hypothetical protein
VVKFGVPNPQNMTTNKIQFKEYIIEQTGRDPKTGASRPTEVKTSGVDAYAALSKFLKRGVNGLGKGWVFTRQPNGWIIASNKNDRVLGRTYHRLKEVNWSRFSSQDL